MCFNFAVRKMGDVVALTRPQEPSKDMDVEAAELRGASVADSIVGGMDLDDLNLAWLRGLSRRLAEIADVT